MVFVENNFSEKKNSRVSAYEANFVIKLVCCIVGKKKQKRK